MSAGGPAGKGSAAWTRWRRRARRRISSARVRIVGWHIVLLAAVLGFVLVSMQVVLMARLDERVDRELTQEAEELRTLAEGTDPETGEPFDGDVTRILEVFLTRSIPARYETFIGYVDGEPALRSYGEPPLRLDLDERATRLWGTATEPERGVIEREPVGRIEYHAVPLRIDGATEGVFLAAWFRDLEAREVREVVALAGILSAGALLLASGIVWNVTGRVLRPAKVVASTAQQISETDLARRIDVTGNDEIAEIGHTFNAMLDRLESAFVGQRAFIDDAGHELRTPITIIRGHLELLELDDPADREATIALVTDELDRMHRMVEDLLLLTKAQRPDFLVLDDVEVHDLVAEVLHKVRGLGERDWRLEGLADATVRADRQRLTQALVQLAHNAVAHTEPGERITVGSHRLADGDAEVVELFVADAGRGVDPADRERIFERFARGSAGRSRGDGAGLGLALVAAIAEAHHGSVEHRPTQGGGATFALRVPIGRSGARDLTEAGERV